MLDFIKKIFWIIICGFTYAIGFILGQKFYNDVKECGSLKNYFNYLKSRHK